MSLPKSSLNGNFPDNSEFQLTDSMKAQDGLTKKAIQGTAVEGKSNAFTEARDTIFRPDGESVGSTIMETVVAPAVRNLASNVIGSFTDILVDSLNRIIFRNDPNGSPTKYNSRGGGYIPYGSNSIFSSNPTGYYNVTNGTTGYSSNRNSQGFSNPSPNIPNRYSNIILENRGEAESFIDDLLYTVRQYQSISVANVYAKLDWASSFQDTKWGWTPETLNENTIVKRRVANGCWRVQLPRPIALDI